MNYTGDRRSVLTLAHELGHGLHGVLAQTVACSTPRPRSRSPRPRRCSARRSRSSGCRRGRPRRRLNLLVGRIDDGVATVFRQIAMNRFEDAVHGRAPRQGELAPDRFAELWIETQTGCSATPSTSSGYETWWSYVPHYVVSPATSTPTPTATCSPSPSSGAGSARSEPRRAVPRPAARGRVRGSRGARRGSSARRRRPGDLGGRSRRDRRAPRRGGVARRNAGLRACVNPGVSPRVPSFACRRGAWLASGGESGRRWKPYKLSRNDGRVVSATSGTGERGGTWESRQACFIAVGAVIALAVSADVRASMSPPSAGSCSSSVRSDSSLSLIFWSSWGGFGWLPTPRRSPRRAVLTAPSRTQRLSSRRAPRTPEPLRVSVRPALGLLEVRDTTRRFGGIVALEEVSFDVEAGEVVGLIGPNGAGKTTAFNVISGLYRPDVGDVVFDGRSIVKSPPHRIVRRGLTRTFQNLELFRTMSVFENVLVGYPRTRRLGPRTAGAGAGSRRFSSISTSMGRGPASRCASVRHPEARRAGAGARRRAAAAPARRAGRRPRPRRGREPGAPP